MQNTRKRICGLALSCALGLSLLPGQALASFAQEDPPQQSGASLAQTPSEGSLRLMDFFLGVGGTLTYETNGGDSIPDLLVDAGSPPVDLKETIPTREGYVFLGWYATPDFSGVPLQSISLSRNRTIYAKWAEARTLTLVYSSYYQILGAPAPETIQYPAGTEVDLSTLTIPAWDGYVFVSWHETDDPLTASVTTVTMDEDKTLYAGWVQGSNPANQYTVTYNTMGGSEIPSESVDKGSTLYLTGESRTPTKEGYVFVGWYESRNGIQMGTSPITSITPSQDRTVFAGWAEQEDVRTLTLAYDPMWQWLGTGTPDLTIDYYVGTQVDLTTLSVDGHEGENTEWYTDSGLDTTITSVTMDTDKTIYAGGTVGGSTGGGGGSSGSGNGSTIGGSAGSDSEKPSGGETADPGYTLSFQTEGGRVLVDGRAVTSQHYDGVISLDLRDMTPIREGYAFDGWYDSAELTGEPLQFLTLTQDTTIFAKWTQSYTLTYDTNGGRALTGQTSRTGDTVDLTDVVPVRTGYTFAGWYDNAELTGEPLTAITLTGDTTLYAKWTLGQDQTMLSGTISDSIGSDGSESSSSGSGSQSSSVPVLLNGDTHVAYVIGDDQGNICPDQVLTRAQASTIFFRLLQDTVREESMTTENPFSDVSPTAWYNTAVSTLAALGIVNGRTDTLFSPNEPITRAELAAICARFDQEVPATTDGSVSAFSDVCSHWAQLEIQQAADLGWVNGYPDGTFCPDQSITRAEAMVLINRVLCRQPESEADLLADMTTWPDNSDAGQWYYLAIQEATNSHGFQQDSNGRERWSSLFADPDWAKYQT